MSRDGRIEHRPTIEWTPESGHATEDLTPFDVTHDDTYADRDEALNGLGEMIKEAEMLLVELEERLKGKQVVVQSPEREPDLAEALSVEWPKSLNVSAPRKIPFEFYKILLGRTTASAAFLSQRFEKLARDVQASSDLDAWIYLRTFITEAKEYESNINNRVTDLVSPLSRRLVEIAQDFAREGIVFTREIRSSVNAQPSLEQQELAPDDVARYLAALKIKSNEFSKEAEARLADFRKMIGEVKPGEFSYMVGSSGDKFWTKLIPGAHRVATEVMSGRQRTSGELDRIVRGVFDRLEQNHQAVLVDQLRRMRFVIDSGKELMDLVRKQRVIRAYHQSLVELGSIKPDSNLDWQDSTVTSEESDAFVEPEPDPPSRFSSPHVDTTGREDPEAHPQYLKIDGSAELKGHLPVAEGVKIAGVDVSGHDHAGSAGKGKQIPGSSIEPQTVTPAVIDPNAFPDVPQNLIVSQQTTNVKPDGSRVTNAELYWDGPEAYAYQIEAVALSQVTNTNLAEVAGSNVDTRPRLYEIFRNTAPDVVPKELFLGEGRINVPTVFLGRVGGRIVVPYMVTDTLTQSVWLAWAQPGALGSWTRQQIYTSETNLRSPCVVLRPDGNGWFAIYKQTIGGYTRLVYFVRSGQQWAVDTTTPLIQESILSTPEPPQMMSGYNRAEDEFALVTFKDIAVPGDIDQVRVVTRSGSVINTDITDFVGEPSGQLPHTVSTGSETHFLFVVDASTVLEARHLIIHHRDSTAEFVTPPYAQDMRWVTVVADHDKKVHAIVWPPSTKDVEQGSDFEHWIYDGTSWERFFTFNEGF